ncbi:MAG: shikimate dehydrogenase [Desulfobacterales bacterium]|nr:shikimate dehydrogenase [Desulfobacterales bacterium]
MILDTTAQRFASDPQIKVFCILSDERAFRSKSPAMFSAVIKRIGMKGVYVPFMVQPNNIGAAMQSLRVLNIAGANITVPYKEVVVPHLDILSEGANIIGSVNTVVRDGEKLKGYNTNAIGFMDALDHIGFEVAGKSALVFGSGGIAKAVVFILNWLRAESIIVTGRNEEKTKQVADRIGGEVRSLHSLTEGSLDVDIIVNATSVSSTEESPELSTLVEKLKVPTCKLMLDFNYGRIQNFWEEMAKARGIRFMDGLRTLAFQARRTFALWTKIQVDPSEFLKAIEGKD